MPGWEPNSWAYHGDDGQVYFTRDQGKPYGTKYGRGDTIGCGINFKSNTAFFTKNGVRIGTAFRDLKSEQLYPVVGLKNQNEHVRVNFGQEPFNFDICAMMQEEKRQIMQEVDRVDPTSLYPPLSERQLIHKLITQYLSHDGYVETVKALSAELDRENAALGAESDPSQLSTQEIDLEESNDALTRQSEYNFCEEPNILLTL
jgi:hypothetical protein